jgi:hypothetical protein
MKFLIKLVVVNFIWLFLFSCHSKESVKEIEKNSFNVADESILLIVFNKNAKNTEFIDRSSSSKRSFQYWRENFDPPFDDPNLYISVFHGLEHGTKIISRKELDKMTVWFDSEMEYMDWFEMRFETYYMIYQDEYLVKGSLDPDHVFVAYQVKISTGGVE